MHSNTVEPMDIVTEAVHHIHIHTVFNKKRVNRTFVTHNDDDETLNSPLLSFQKCCWTTITVILMNPANITVIHTHSTCRTRKSCAAFSFTFSPTLWGPSALSSRPVLCICSAGWLQIQSARCSLQFWLRWAFYHWSKNQLWFLCNDRRSFWIDSCLDAIRKLLVSQVFIPYKSHTSGHSVVTTTLVQLN